MVARYDEDDDNSQSRPGSNGNNGNGLHTPESHKTVVIPHDTLYLFILK